MLFDQPSRQQTGPFTFMMRTSVKAVLIYVNSHALRISETRSDSALLAEPTLRSAAA